jgi:hypothetical protein
MEITVKVLQDASQAAEQMIEAFGKLGTLLVNAMTNGVSGVEWVEQSSVLNKLNKLSVTLTFLTVRQKVFFVPSVKTYLSNPIQENWDEVKTNISTTVNICTEILNTLQATRHEIATENFFEDLVALMMERDKTLHELLKMPRPSTPSEMEALGDHIERYSALLDSLDKANDSLKTFLEQHGINTSH